MPIIFSEKPAQTHQNSLMALGRALDNAIREQLGAIMRIPIEQIRRVELNGANLRVELTAGEHPCLTIEQIDVDEFSTVERGDNTVGLFFPLSDDERLALIELLSLTAKADPVLPDEIDELRAMGREKIEAEPPEEEFLFSDEELEALTSEADYHRLFVAKTSGKARTETVSEFDMECAECGVKAHSDWAEWYSETKCFKCYQARQAQEEPKRNWNAERFEDDCYPTVEEPKIES